MKPSQDVKKNETLASSSDQQSAATPIPPSARRAYDKDVSFEEYLHRALETRNEEQQGTKSDAAGSMSEQINLHIVDHSLTSSAHSTTGDGGSGFQSLLRKKEDPIDQQSQVRTEGRAVITENEWRNASRAKRTASWAAGFYLITTDVLGPYGVGFALGTLGWGPGIVLYTVFGFMAGYSGYLLWHTYMGLDSYDFPIRSYGDLTFRIYGSTARHIIDVLQSLQLCLLCGQVIVQSGQAISQISRFRLCYVVCIIIFVVAGFLIGQVRTLRSYGIISALAVGCNVLIILITMGVMAHSPPNHAIAVLGSAGSAVDPSTITPDAQGRYPPVRHYGGLPDSSSLIGSINGLMQGVFAYGGATIFVEIMTEMRQPWDFIKSLSCAQVFIWVVYLVYGCYTYHWQGQYAFQVSFLGLSVYGFSVVCDLLGVIAGLIVAGLYGNIGIKVFYNNVLLDLCRAPNLTTKNGRRLFAVIVPIYWTIAFVVAASIPDYFGFVSVISAFCVVEFSYAIPPILHLGFTIQKNAMRADWNEGYDPLTGQTRRRDSGLMRWIRGFFADRWYVNVWHVIHAGAALAVAGLGGYAAIEGLIQAFKNPQVTAFTCTSPLNLNATT